MKTVAGHYGPPPRWVGLKPGPMVINGVNNQQSVCPHGLTLSGLCVDDITEPFPFYPLKEVEKDFRAQIGTCVNRENRKMFDRCRA